MRWRTWSGAPSRVLFAVLTLIFDSVSSQTAFNTVYSSSSLEIQGYTPDACMAATPCPLYVFLTGTGMNIREPELMLLREMAARGFVGGFVAYPENTRYPQDDRQWDEKAQAVWQGGSGALAVLCARAAVDCDLGIAVHGFSQGAGLASLAAQYDSRVGAALLFGIGTCVRSESQCAQGNGVSTVLQASSQSAYLAVNVCGLSRVSAISARCHALTARHAPTQVCSSRQWLVFCSCT